MPGTKILDQIKIEYRNFANGELLPVYINVYDSSLSEKWLTSLNNLLENNFHLEKNYCMVGFLQHQRNGEYILNQVNKTIDAINQSDIGYTIDDFFSMENCFSDEPRPGKKIQSRHIVHEKLNQLHRYFEDTQGVSRAISPIAQRASPEIKWHIRQLNLLCHEFESWALSYRKEHEAPDWICPSQLMCWLNAPRFELDHNDYESFGIHTLDRSIGGVYVGVNKAVGKHHWEVFHDEGRDSRLDELTTTTLSSQTEAAGDFDIEWGRNNSSLLHRKQELKEFGEWLISNGFDPDDPQLTIGHPQVGQVDIGKSFNTNYPNTIWEILGQHLDVYTVSTSDASAVYDYHWSDADFMQRQINIIGR